jgi:hypothetical protein
MAISTGNSTELQRVLASTPNRRIAQNLDQLTLEKKVARFNVAGLGSSIDTASYYDLGKLIGVNGATIVVEECRLRFGGTGTPDVKFQLKKANQAEQDSTGAGTITALSAATSTVSALTATVTLSAVATAGTSYAVGDSDMIRLYLTTGASVCTLPTTTTVEVELTYTVPGC